jgi:hypothetical protein
MLEVEGPDKGQMVGLRVALAGGTQEGGSRKESASNNGYFSQSNPAEIQTHPVKFKLFNGESEDDDAYFELYLNTDLANNRVQLGEKDAGYRSGVLKALGAE